MQKVKNQFGLGNRKFLTEQLQVWYVNSRGKDVIVVYETEDFSEAEGS